MVNPLGLSALTFSIWNTTSSTSAGSIVLIRSALWSGVISLGMCLIMVAVAGPLSSSISLNRLEKNVTNSYTIYFWESRISPSMDFKREIRLFYLCCMVDLWKKLVLWSPSLSHSLYDFCCHRISSCFSLCISSCIRDFSTILSSSEKPSVIVLVWISSSCCSGLHLSWVMLSKYSLFQRFRHSFMCLSLCCNTYILEPSSSWKELHHSFILLRKSGWVSQNPSNLNGRLMKSPSRPHSKHIGQWSDPAVGRTVAPISPAPPRADFDIMNQSSLEAICLSPTLLFCQVKRLLVVWMSTSWSSSINLLMTELALLRDRTPLFFSSKDLIMLKSPPIT